MHVKEGEKASEGVVRFWRMRPSRRVVPPPTPRHRSPCLSVCGRSRESPAVPSRTPDLGPPLLGCGLRRRGPGSGARAPVPEAFHHVRSNKLITNAVNTHRIDIIDSILSMQSGKRYQCRGARITAPPPPTHPHTPTHGDKWMNLK